LTAGALYRLYGLALSTPLDLPCPAVSGARRTDVRLRAGSRARFAALRSLTRSGRPSRSWFTCRRLDDGATYLRWAGLFEFLVAPDGRDIRFHRLPKATWESLSTYLLGQVLSFSLLAFGVEPLHGTAVVVDGRAIGFLGDCGYGKSTLGAAFLRLGYPILTDDLMVLARTRSGWDVQPGMPRIKLFPGVARPVLGVARGVAPLNDGTAKQIFPLGEGQAYRRPAPLHALYVLPDPATAERRDAERIAIEPLSAGAALLEIVRSTFNTIVTDRARLARQFAFASELAAAVSVRRLSYARSLTRLPAVCEAVLADRP
jgi:hypothetical protein